MLSLFGRAKQQRIGLTRLRRDGEAYFSAFECPLLAWPKGVDGDAHRGPLVHFQVACTPIVWSASS